MNVESTNDAHQYLTFKLDREVFALGIDKVREVLDYTAITRVPKTPDFMRGVINVRGGVVPVVDLRVKFGMEPTPQTVNTCIIIVEIFLEGESTILGALADQVEEVLDLLPAQIEPAPRIGTRLRTDFIKGMGKTEERFIILLDIDRVFSSEELALVAGEDQKMAAQA
ncbi:chemotaxis protein CheW [Geoalkalibacter sp.]|uniref:chemotaxis protein CheW n=1 Tax=Geoalkalibacter sp. TaxID=3041440 RepID=UPI00272EA4E2|nr:chemotaxis protein CheW [Geoalkalibacter sp.]